MSLWNKLRWYYVTRAIGAVTAIYEVFIDKSPDRGTIILAAFGVIGFDWVAKGNAKDRKS